ncbi:heterodisulfide reductase-related iron-sulfur binding cluster [Vibrio sp. SCSIO 43153]|uniref:heterodisulfide reductase-related iron-sulfur binding cluster n=1 Tax=Vibrio sp. SCSIO 43153 TaxID=2819098 RepID=UPI0033659466
MSVVTLFVSDFRAVWVNFCCGAVSTVGDAATQPQFHHWVINHTKLHHWRANDFAFIVSRCNVCYFRY